MFSRQKLSQLVEELLFVFSILYALYDTTLYMTENTSSIFSIQTYNIKPICLITIMGRGQITDKQIFGP